MLYSTRFSIEYRSCENARVMHQSFVTTAPHLQGRVGDSLAKVRGNYFSSVPAVQEKYDGFLTLGSLPEGDFLLLRVGQRAKF